MGKSLRHDQFVKFAWSPVDPLNGHELHVAWMTYFVYGPQFSVEADLMPQMRACATHAFSAVLNKLNPMRRQHCFELFGLDFMVDARHKVACHAVTCGALLLTVYECMLGLLLVL